MVKNLPVMQETGVRFRSGRSPGGGNGNPSSVLFFFFYPPVFLPGKSDGQRSLLGYKAIGSQQQYLQGKFLEVGLLGQKVKRNSFVSKD